jgi:hypothetical protein
MSTAFPFTVGDRVRLAEWTKGEYVTITAVGEWYFLAMDGPIPDRELPYRKNLGPMHHWFRYGTIGAAA